MRIRSFLVIVSILSGSLLNFKNASSQLYYKMNYQIAGNIKPISVINPDTTFNFNNIRRLYPLADSALAQVNITWKPELAGFGIKDNFDGKWAILAGKPSFPLSGNYSGSSKSGDAALSDNCMYRVTATVFNFWKYSRYRSLNEPGK
jgi:hypothetical protein